MRITIAFAVACVLASSATATAGRIGYEEDFIGWSPDGSFYVMTVSGTDERFVPALCLSKRGVASRTWPKNVPVPAADDENGCTGSWDMMFPDDQTPLEDVVAKVRAWVDDVKPAVRGPGGETVAAKRVDGAIVEVAASRKGKRIARGFIELKFESMAVPDTTTTYWRKDGGAVAVVLEYSGDKGPGYGPPTFLVVLPLDGSTANAAAPQTPRQRAKALNVEGMKSLNAKQLDKAQQQFQASVDADETFMLAYYNLACTASLRKDREASIKALKVLAGSNDKDAKAYLAKGLTDHDLDWIGEDPEGAKILKRKPKK